MGTSCHRQAAASGCSCPACQTHPRGATAGQHRLLNRLVRCVDERTRRLLAGLFALRHGKGGISLMARVTGLSRPTVRKGLRELRRGVGLAPGRVRRKGGGRKRAEITHPGR
jgi:hypothetical protein